MTEDKLIMEIKKIKSLVLNKNLKQSNSNQISLEGVYIIINNQNILTFAREKHLLKRFEYMVGSKNIITFKDYYSLQDIETQEVIVDYVEKNLWRSLGVYKSEEDKILSIPAHYIIPRNYIHNFAMMVSKDTLIDVKNIINNYLENNIEFYNNIFNEDNKIRKLK